MQTINFPEYVKVLPLKNPNEINLKDTVPNKIYKVDGGRIDVENNNYYWYETTNFAPSTKTEFLNQIKLNKMENKQTPVEFLIENLKMILPISQFNDVVMQDVFKQSKEMEERQKKQIAIEFAKWMVNKEWEKNIIKPHTDEEVVSFPHAFKLYENNVQTELNRETGEIKFINNTGWLTTYREEQLIKAIELARETKEVEGFRFPIPKYTEQEIIDIINS